MNASSFYRGCLVFYITCTLSGNKPTNKIPKEELIGRDKKINILGWAGHIGIFNLERLFVSWFASAPVDLEG